MMKKVLYGVAVALFALVSIGTLQSCKDDLSDLRNQTQYNVSDLSSQLNRLKLSLNAQKLRLDSLCKADKDSIDKILGYLKEYATIEYVDSLCGELERSRFVGDSLLQDSIDSVASKMNGAIVRLGKVEGALNGKVDTIDYNALKRTVDGIKNKVDTLGNGAKLALHKLEGTVESQGKSITAMETRLKNDSTKLANFIAQYGADTAANGATHRDIYSKLQDINNRLDNIKDLTPEVTALQTAVNQMNTTISSIQANVKALQDANVDIQNQLASVRVELSTLTNDLSALTGRVSAVESKLDVLTQRVDRLITGILIQATDNPIFGNFSLPIGIKSNMLFNWYGFNQSEIESFPSSDNVYAYDKELPGIDVSDAEKVTIKQKYMEDVNLGQLYLTINPIGHNFNNASFSLETSAAKRLPYSLEVKKSDKELYWIHDSRAGADNGFYVANVTMPAKEDAINATEIEIESGLKTAMKDALKDRTKRNAVNLLKALYSQMVNMLPAYGVRYDWNVADKPYAVISNYDLAIATARPLSYQFLYGKGTTRHLPIHGYIDNFFADLIDKDKLQIKIPQDFHVNEFKFDFKGLNINVTAKADVNYTESIEVTIPGFTVYGTVENTDQLVRVDVKDQTATITSKDLEGLITAIKEGFDKAIADMNKQLKTQINDQIRTELIGELETQVNTMLKDIEDSVNNMLKDLQGSINDQIGDIIDDIMSSIENKTGSLFDRVNKAIDIYNKAAGKINNMLKDPNNYLQVAMFYQGNGTVGVLSTNKLDPTPFVNAGGNAISLFASSYTGEIIAPAFKKYIAVSNVYEIKGNGKNKTVELVANSKDLCKEINKASGLNKVFDGCTKRVGVAASKLQKNHVYEIVYQGLDYSGVTSTQKFYIQVK